MADSNTNITPSVPNLAVYKTYLDKEGLQAYHEKVKEALRKRALKSDLDAYLTKVEASETYVTKNDLNDEIEIDSITDEEIEDICK